jgi:hypothetical protein
MDAKVLLVVDDHDEPNLALLERVLRSGGVTAFARACVSRDLEARPAPLRLDLQAPGIAP